MPAGHDNARLAALVGATGQNLTGDLKPQAIGETQEIERKDRGSPHGPYVRKGICCRDLPK